MKAGEASQQASGNTAAIPNAMDSGINALLSLATAANSSADYPSKFASDCVPGTSRIPDNGLIQHEQYDSVSMAYGAAPTGNYHDVGEFGPSAVQGAPTERTLLELPKDRALTKEVAFQLLAQGTKVLPNVPCRASASPIDRRIPAFYVSSIKAPAGRAEEDIDNEISVQFQSIANSELWWSNYVHDGNRLGIVARHMSRRTRIQRKVGADNTVANGGDELHGYQGRWFCLVQAPNSIIDTRSGPSKLKIAKALPGAYSLVQIWKAPGADNRNPQRGKRKRTQIIVEQQRVAAVQAAAAAAAQAAITMGAMDMIDGPAWKRSARLPLPNSQRFTAAKKNALAASTDLKSTRSLTEKAAAEKASASGASAVEYDAETVSDDPDAATVGDDSKKADAKLEKSGAMDAKSNKSEKPGGKSKAMPPLMPPSEEAMKKAFAAAAAAKNLQLLQAKAAAQGGNRPIAMSGDMTASSATFAAAFASAVASTRESHLSEALREVSNLRAMVESLQSQLNSERALRSNLELKVNTIIASLPTLPSLVSSLPGSR